jgi:hypothetical protein
VRLTVSVLVPLIYVCFSFVKTKKKLQALLIYIPNLGFVKMLCLYYLIVTMCTSCSIDGAWE